MKSQRLSDLLRTNAKLRNNSWNNYLEFLRVVLRSVDHPQASAMLDCLSRGDIAGLVDVADYGASSVYRTPAEHRLCNQLSALVRKYPIPSVRLDCRPKEKALRTFLSSEHKCKLVNKRFRFFDTLRSPHERDLHRARQWVQYVLGDLCLSDVWAECSFGPGASIGVHGNATNDARKLLASRWSVSIGAYHYARAAVSCDIHIQELLLGSEDSRFYPLGPVELSKAFSERAHVVDYNKLAFVPKTVRTERTIAVEPLMNGYLQKGLDLLMRKRLKRVGIDLQDQTLNQGLALMGSIPGHDDDPYVTIDLSSASDSISIGLARNLLPSEWFSFMDAIRSKSYLMNGEVIPYHKFTTMGNGFCFPLETLIFASLCHAAYAMVGRPDDFSVYGDDIIVRASVAGHVLELLKVCGFKPNLDKTFLQGPFRESCGADWFEGEDVRPVSLDYAFESIENIFKFCNIVRSKDRLESILYDGLEFLESLIPPKLMFTRPYKGQVDTALEVPFDVFMSSRYAKYNRDLQCWSWLEVVHEPSHDFRVSRIARYNLALMRGACRGVSSVSPFTERRKTCTKIRRISYSGGWSLYLPGVLFSRLGDHPLPI